MATTILNSFRDFLFGRKKKVTVPERPSVLRASNGLTFRVLEEKRGGMGVVSICEMLGDDKRKQKARVALKSFDEAYFFDVGMSSVVEKETTIWARLSDIAYVFPLMAILSIDKKPYLMMPCAGPNCAGAVTLADEIRGSAQALGGRACIKVGLCVSIAMSLAEEKLPGIVHGDIKPANLLYLGELLFLSDFGLAEIRRASEKSTTWAGGTPPYMAPELWVPDAIPSVKSDVYALGIMLFEVLDGRYPLTDGPAEARERSHDEWAFLHRTAEVRFHADHSATSGYLRAKPYLDLEALILRCIAKEPEARPKDFAEVMSELSAIGLLLAPDVPFMVMQGAAGWKQMADARRKDTLPMMLSSLLEEGHHEAAMDLLLGVPPHQLQGKLLLLAGRTYSHNGKGEEALALFERFLGEHEREVDDDDRLRCLNEKGLSLKRLGRLPEAEAVFEQVLEATGGEGEHANAARGNHAGVLLEIGETDEAIQELSWLTRKNPGSPEGWALYSMALARKGSLAEAIAAIQRAIGLRPRMGLFQVSYADLLIKAKRPDEALVALDAAYGLGFHSRDWVKLTIAVSIALGRTGDAMGLVEGVGKDISEKEAMSVLHEAMNVVAEMVGEKSEKSDQTDGSEPEPVVPGGSGGQDNLPQRTEPPMPDKPTGKPAAQETSSAGSIQSANPSIGEHANEEEHREAIRAGRQAHLQIRTSMVDNSFAIDFYSDPYSPSFVEDFEKGYKSAKWRVSTMNVDERSHSYRFARCTLCGTRLLTARDEGERFLCQGCGERGPIQTDESEGLADIAASCELAIGRGTRGEKRTKGTLILGLWLDEKSNASKAVELVEHAGLKLIPGDAMAYQFLLTQVRDRGIHRESPPTHVWQKRIDSTGDISKNAVPPGVDLLIRTIRRECGNDLLSASILIPESLEQMMLANAVDRRQILRSIAAKDPDDLGVQEALVQAELKAGNMDEARRVAGMLEVKHAGTAQARRARAALAICENRAAEAVPLLEEMLEFEPRDFAARASLIKAYDLLGHVDKARHHRALALTFGIAGVRAI